MTRVCFRGRAGTPARQGFRPLLLVVVLGVALVACTPSLDGAPGAAPPARSSVPGSSGAGPAATPLAPVVMTSGSTTVTVRPPSAPLGPATGLPTGSADAAVQSVVPGLYGLDSLRPLVHGSTVDLSVAESCSFVMDVIRSGQWADEVIDAPHDDVSTYLVVLTRGGRSALLSLGGPKDHCSGSIVADTTQQFTASGAVTVAGPAQAVTVLCRATIDDDHPGQQVIAMSYSTPAGGFLAVFGAPEAVGAHPVDPDNQAAVALLDPKKPALSQAATGMVGMFDPSKYQADGTLFGVDQSKTWAQGDGATITITKSSPLTGVLRAPAMVNAAGKPGTLDLTAGFRCD